MQTDVYVHTFVSSKMHAGIGLQHWTYVVQCYRSYWCEKEWGLKSTQDTPHHASALSFRLPSGPHSYKN